MRGRDEESFGPDMDLVTSLFLITLLVGVLVWIERSAKPAPPPSPGPEQAKGEEQKVLGEDVFELGSDKLSDKGKTVVEQAVKEFRTKLLTGTAHLEVVGHASPDTKVEPGAEKAAPEAPPPSGVEEKKEDTIPCVTYLKALPVSANYRLAFCRAYAVGHYLVDKDRGSEQVPEECLKISTYNTAQSSTFADYVIKKLPKNSPEVKELRDLFAEEYKAKGAHEEQLQRERRVQIRVIYPLEGVGAKGCGILMKALAKQTPVP